MIEEEKSLKNEIFANVIYIMTDNFFVKNPDEYTKIHDIFDEIDLLQFIIDIEDKFHVIFLLDEISKFETVNDLVNKIYELQKIS